MSKKPKNYRTYIISKQKRQFTKQTARRTFKKAFAIAISALAISSLLCIGFAFFNSFWNKNSVDENGIEIMAIGKKYLPTLDVSSVIEADVIAWMKKKSDMPEETLKKIYEATRLYDNSDLVLAMSCQESAFNPGAKSFANAVGLMGVMPSVWARELKKVGIIKEPRDLYSIDENLHAGVYILNLYVKQYKSFSIALDKYSGGASDYRKKVLTLLGEIYLVRMNSAYVHERIVHKRNK